MNDWQDAELHADRALEMFERGRWAEAEAELRKALSLNPGQAEWHYNLALTLEAAGRDTEAMSSFLRASELMPDEVAPLVGAAAASNRIGQPDRAIEWLEQALRIDSAYEPAYPQVIEAHCQRGDHEAAETAFYMSQQMLEHDSAHCLAAIAESLIEREDYRRAAWCLKESLRLEPNMPRLRARLGAVYAATNQPKRAMQMFLRDLRDDPGNIDTLLDYGDLLAKLRRWPGAAEKYRRVLELEPANVDAHFRLGEVAMEQGRFQEARIEFELVAKLDATYPAIHLSLAEACLRAGRDDIARQYLAEAPQHLSDEPDKTAFADRIRLGDLLLQVGFAREAVVQFERALEMRPDDLPLLRKSALARFESGDRDGGVKVSRRVLRFDPTCVVSMHNLALAALQTRRLSLAAGWIKRGLRQSPHDEGLRRLRVRLWVDAVKSVFSRLRFRSAKKTAA